MNSLKFIKYVCFCIVFFSAIVGANSIPINTTDWQDYVSPSSGRLSTQDVWVGLENNTPTKLGNSSGALVSNFDVTGDFSFSGSFSPTFADNQSCFQENTCNDDDIIGLVFGWVDADNHYRLGWSQGGVSDITGREGLYLVREENGRSTTLFNLANLYWVDNQTYDFTIQRTGEELSFSLFGDTSSSQGTQTASILGVADLQNTSESLINHSITDSTFLTGGLGVFTESQTGTFSLENITGSIVEVAAPSTALLFGIWALLAIRRQNVRRGVNVS